MSIHMMVTNRKRASPKLVKRSERDLRIRKDKSPVMRMVIDVLDKDRRDLAWLAEQIGRSRQAISAWEWVPDKHVPDVARILRVPESKIRRPRP